MFSSIVAPRLFWRFFRNYTILVSVFALVIGSLSYWLGSLTVQREIERVQALTIGSFATALDENLFSLKRKILTALNSEEVSAFQHTLERRESRLVICDYPSYDSLF
jgi:hypothetical protein